MKGGTLIVTRAVNLHKFYKSKIEVFGFNDVSTTDVDKDGLNTIIEKLKPQLVLMDAIFYEAVTPYMMNLLLRQFPKLNIAVVSMSNYPADLAMSFISNGVSSYISFWDGVDQFNYGLNCVRNGKCFVSASVQERINMRYELPETTRNLTDRHIEVMRLICNGFSVEESADCLHLSKRTVGAHKREIYQILSVRNENELIRSAIFLGLIKPDELVFYGRDFELKPKVTRKKKHGEKNDCKNQKR